MLRTFFFKLALLIHLTPIALFAQDSVTARVLDEVVVTGQFAPQSVKNSVYRVRVIKKEQIQMRGATDVAGVLNNELGIRFTTDYTLGETDITIMGMSGQKCKKCCSMVYPLLTVAAPNKVLAISISIASSVLKWWRDR
jgi:Outer membrane cobalamin receptor protein